VVNSIILQSMEVSARQGVIELMTHNIIYFKSSMQLRWINRQGMEVSAGQDVRFCR